MSARAANLDAELISILCCPETHQPVRLAEADLVGAINAAIAAGQVTNRGGAKVSERVDGGLVREDGKVVYPVRDDIPVMLVEEAIALPLGAGHAG